MGNAYADRALFSFLVALVGNILGGRRHGTFDLFRARLDDLAGGSGLLVLVFNEGRTVQNEGVKRFYEQFFQGGKERKNLCVLLARLYSGRRISHRLQRYRFGNSAGETEEDGQRTFALRLGEGARNGVKRRLSVKIRIRRKLWRKSERPCKRS